MPFQPEYDVADERRAYTLPGRADLPTGGRVGVLILHGFMGSPLSSRPLAEYLNERGIFAHCPLLPGHGHYPDKLKDATRQDWLAEAEEAHDFARRQVDELFIIAHSMGNVLAAHVALKYNDSKGVTMIAPVIDVPDNRLRYVKYARFFMPWYYPHKSKRESMQHLVRERVLDFDPTIDYDSPEFQAILPDVSRVPLAGMHSMVSTIEYGRKLWPRLDIPVRVFAGADDFAAPPDNARQIYDLLPSRDKELKVYPNAGHEMMRPFEPIHQTLWEAILAFIEDHTTLGLTQHS